MFEFYRALVRLRHEDPVVAHGDFRMLAEEHPYLVAFTRSLEGSSILVIANFGVATLDLGAEAELATWSSSRALLGNYPHRAALDDLRPWEVRVLRRS